MRVFGQLIVIIFMMVNLSSCEKQGKKEICCHDILSIRPVALGFVGYDSTDLKNLRLFAYKRDSNFQNPVDSIFGRDYDFSFRHDTATVIAATAGKFFIAADIDYVISILDSSSVHTITKQVEGEKQTDCIEMEHCSPGSSQAIILPIQNIHVDGNLTAPDENIFPPAIFITK